MNKEETERLDYVMKRLRNIHAQFKMYFNDLEEMLEKAKTKK